MTSTSPVPPNSPLAAILDRVTVIPVVTIDRVADAVPLARALAAGGLKVIEITLRTPAAPHAIEAIAASVPEAIVGAGTVLNEADLVRALSFGARFAVSPGATPRLLDAAVRAGVPFLPGVATASELMVVLERGYDTVKFFPAAAAGGIPALKALSAPFPSVRFCPTGGIGEADLAAWLALPCVAAVGGSWLAPRDLIARADWAAITALARRSSLTGFV